ncbi:MAG: DUF3311 domain-containing protein [Burkholderiales bacterium]|nr:DUF3311 domain-containing protein [Burkholderiales bacterium]
MKVRRVLPGWAYVLLALPCLAIVWVGSYNQVEPTWLGIPFFYWYQLVLVVFSMVTIGVAYFSLREVPDASSSAESNQ